MSSFSTDFVALTGLGRVSFGEYAARVSGYLNGGAPEPLFEGTEHERRAVLERLAAGGDSQMRAYVQLKVESAEPPS